MTMDDMMAAADPFATAEGHTMNGHDDTMNGYEDGGEQMERTPEEAVKMKIMKHIESDKFSGQKTLLVAVGKLPVRHVWAKAQR